ncbi:thiamine pyrophosphate-binding protein [Rathayibacter tritici]|uniref:Thiamine pyrophosphate-binding protein n=1 Tax=Rathayibacter tritici TaxID=33888 RepID=A0A160KVY0_9MICO|nr:thiamine pyrophosphate-binding protein [Rathayibacter tritici]AND17889.1 thiamine pyrophosphate-binding protein [Rathayibacter tritici]PPF30558.1 thiamine pyrophosphate-binding protein [Rathayibacter tritici]PPF66687.1 thiamine pyrophosphate-binding protein [Rathayibacter tritici]PPG09072.1 thiamine pyrophosphate-binding protein [Rathayibacter tritici]PPI17856.1 thiamine pyrophosphate-binding protein [Rathayibacter tritici]
MPSVSAHVAHSLAFSVRHVFGVMGAGNAHLIDAVERHPRARFIPLRHEGGAVVAADAHFRAGGSLAAATTTCGPGFTNTLTALAEAALARSPLLLVAGDEPSTGRRPWGVDQSAMARAAGVRTFTVGIRDAAYTTVRAIEHALAERTPVVLAIPADLATAEAAALPRSQVLRRAGRRVPSSTDIARLASMIAAAERPLLVAGRGAWLADAGGALGELADLTGAVTASSVLGLGTFPSRSHDLGVLGGFGATGALSLVHDADLALVIGSSLDRHFLRCGELFAPATRVVQVDITPAATDGRVDDYIRGDARLVAEALVAELRTRRRSRGEWRDCVDPDLHLARDEGDQRAADGRLDPRSTAVALAALLPEDRVVVTDGGHFLGWPIMHWPHASPERLVTLGTAFQAVGLGIPAVVGAALARPETTVVLVTGDGGGLMALADLESAIRVAGGRGVAVVWNDAAYGAELNVYGALGLAEGPMLIPEVDFAGVATSLGAEGVVVRTMADLSALAVWTGQDPVVRPFLLLDLRISPQIVAPYLLDLLHAAAAR